jgi:hypothetical protein
MRQTDAPLFRPLELLAVTVESASCRSITERGSVRDSNVVSAERTCSSALTYPVTLAAVDRDGDDLLVEQALLLGGHRTLIGAQRELIRSYRRIWLLPTKMISLAPVWTCIAALTMVCSRESERRSGW